MNFYRVSVDSVTGNRNRVFGKGETVNEEQFAPGLAKELLSQGFLEILHDDISVQQPEKVKQKEPTMEDYTRIEIIEKLKKAGVRFSNNSSKVELYEKIKIL